MSILGACQTIVGGILVAISANPLGAKLLMDGLQDIRHGVRAAQGKEEIQWGSYFISKGVSYAITAVAMGLGKFVESLKDIGQTIGNTITNIGSAAANILGSATSITWSTFSEVAYQFITSEGIQRVAKEITMSVVKDRLTTVAVKKITKGLNITREEIAKYIEKKIVKKLSTTPAKEQLEGLLMIDQCYQEDHNEKIIKGAARALLKPKQFELLKFAQMLGGAAMSNIASGHSDIVVQAAKGAGIVAEMARAASEIKKLMKDIIVKLQKKISELDKQTAGALVKIMHLKIKPAIKMDEAEDIAKILVVKGVVRGGLKVEQNLLTMPLNSSTTDNSQNILSPYVAAAAGEARKGATFTSGLIDLGPDPEEIKRIYKSDLSRQQPAKENIYQIDFGPYQSHRQQIIQQVKHIDKVSSQDYSPQRQNIARSIAAEMQGSVMNMIQSGLIRPITSELVSTGVNKLVEHFAHLNEESKIEKELAKRENTNLAVAAGDSDVLEEEEELSPNDTPAEESMSDAYKSLLAEGKIPVLDFETELENVDAVQLRAIVEAPKKRTKWIKDQAGNAIEWIEEHREEIGTFASLYASRGRRRGPPQSIKGVTRRVGESKVLIYNKKGKVIGNTTYQNNTIEGLNLMNTSTPPSLPVNPNLAVKTNNINLATRPNSTKMTMPPKHPAPATSFTKPSSSPVLAPRPLLHEEGIVGTYGHLTHTTTLQRLNLEAHHMPHKYFMEKYGVSKNKGVSILVSKDTHQNYIHKNFQKHKATNPRDALAESVRKSRKVSKEEGTYPFLREKLQKVIKLNNTEHPHVFRKNTKVNYDSNAKPVSELPFNKTEPNSVIENNTSINNPSQNTGGKTGGQNDNLESNNPNNDNTKAISVKNNQAIQSNNALSELTLFSKESNDNFLEVMERHKESMLGIDARMPEWIKIIVLQAHPIKNIEKYFKYSSHELTITIIAPKEEARPANEFDQNNEKSALIKNAQAQPQVDLAQKPQEEVIIDPANAPSLLSENSHSQENIILAHEGSNDYEVAINLPVPAKDLPKQPAIASADPSPFIASVEDSARQFHVAQSDNVEAMIQENPDSEDSLLHQQTTLTMIKSEIPVIFDKTKVETSFHAKQNNVTGVYKKNTESYEVDEDISKIQIANAQPQKTDMEQINVFAKEVALNYTALSIVASAIKAAYDFYNYDLIGNIVQPAMDLNSLPPLVNNVQSLNDNLGRHCYNTRNLLDEEAHLYGQYHQLTDIY